MVQNSVTPQEKKKLKTMMKMTMLIRVLAYFQSHLSHGISHPFWNGLTNQGACTPHQVRAQVHLSHTEVQDNAPQPHRGRTGIPWKNLGCIPLTRTYTVCYEGDEPHYKCRSYLLLAMHIATDMGVKTYSQMHTCLLLHRAMPITTVMVVRPY